MNLYVNEGWSVIWVLASLVGMAVAAKAEPGPAASGGAPAFTLPALPYAQDALEPYISARTMGFHYGKHHQAYVDNLNKLVAGTPWAAGPSLEKVVLESAGMADKAAVFNNAAQAWNHDLLLEEHEAGWWRKTSRASAETCREIVRQLR